MIASGNKSHHVHIKYFNRFMCYMTKFKPKKHFRKYCLQFFSSEKVLVKHGQTYVKINGKQPVTLRSGSINFINHFKQLAVLFKI